MSNKKWKMTHIFVVFSEYMNFTECSARQRWAIKSGNGSGSSAGRLQRRFRATAAPPLAAVENHFN